MIFVIHVYSYQWKAYTHLVAHCLKMINPKILIKIMYVFFKFMGAQQQLCVFLLSLFFFFLLFLFHTRTGKSTDRTAQSHDSSTRKTNRLHIFYMNRSPYVNTYVFFRGQFPWLPHELTHGDHWGETHAGQQYHEHTTNVVPAKCIGLGGALGLIILPRAYPWGERRNERKECQIFMVNWCVHIRSNRESERGVGGRRKIVILVC